MSDSASPPDSTEPARRVRSIMSSGLVAVGDLVRFVIDTTAGDFVYTAELSKNGHIVNPKELRAPTPPPKDAKFKHTDFSSPSHFATTMYDFAQSRLPRSATRPYVNGWKDCVVNNKTLQDLFNKHIRSISKSSQSKRDVDEDVTIGSALSAEEIKKELFYGDKRKGSGKSERNDGDSAVEKRKPDEKESADKEKGEREPKTKEVKKDKSKDDVKTTEDNSDKEKVKNSDGDEKESNDSKKLEKQANGVVPNKGDKKEVSEDDGPVQTEAHAYSKREKGKRAEKSKKASKYSGVENGAKSGGLAGMEVDDDDDDDDANDVKKDKEEKNGGKDRVEKMEIEAKQVADTSGGNRNAAETENGGEMSPSPEKTSDTSSDELAQRAKRKTVGAKSQKRKRSITPQSDVERATRARSRRRILDPAAAEAAAVAAAADKQEAAALRRTTRLTSGKIAKVQYTSNNKPMATDTDNADDHLYGGQVQLRSSRRRDGSKRTPRRTRGGGNGGGSSGGTSNSTGHNANGKNDDEDMASDRTDDDNAAAEEKKEALDMLDELGWAIRRTGSTTPTTIISELRGKSINVDDAKQFLSSMLDDIREVNALAGHKSEGRDLGDQMLAYVAVEAARWQADVPRPVSELTRRRATLEKKRAAMDKSKRRTKREMDDAIAKLENEFDERRKRQVEAARAQASLTSVKMKLKTEKELLNALKKKIEEASETEQFARKQGDKAKRLWSQLLQVTKDNEAAKRAGAGAAAAASAAASGSATARKEDESASSEDEPRPVVPSPESEHTLDPERAAELDHLRKLVRLREAEAEQYQRQCEVAAAKLKNLLNIKKNLDNQLYRRKSKSKPTRNSGVMNDKAIEKKSKSANGRKANSGPQKSIKKSSKKEERAKRKSKPVS